MTYRETDGYARTSDAIRTWLREEPDFAPERETRIDHILDDIDKTKQRRRWWPLNPFGRRAVHSVRATDHASAGTDVALRLRGHRPRRRSTNMLSPVRVVATLAIVALGSSALLYSANQAPTALPGGTDVESAYAADVALLDKSSEAWSKDDRALLEEAYAPDAVHRVAYHDRVMDYEGIDAIAKVAMIPTDPLDRIGNPIELRGRPGESRYMTVTDLWGGTVCAFAISDGQITRHECLAPKTFNGAPFVASDLEPGESPFSLDAEALYAVSLSAWNDDDVEALEAVYAQDAVLTSVFMDEVVVSDGFAEISDVAMLEVGAMTSLQDPIGLPAPADELRWVSITSLAGGTVCSMWARDGQIVRHDCLVPSNSPF